MSKKYVPICVFVQPQYRRWTDGQTIRNGKTITLRMLRMLSAIKMIAVNNRNDTQAYN